MEPDELSNEERADSEAQDASLFATADEIGRSVALHDTVEMIKAQKEHWSLFMELMREA